VNHDALFRALRGAINRPPIIDSNCEGISRIGGCVLVSRLTSVADGRSASFSLRPFENKVSDSFKTRYTLRR
jgi:hypothetical protein